MRPGDIILFIIMGTITMLGTSLVFLAAVGAI